MRLLTFLCFTVFILSACKHNPEATNVKKTEINPFAYCSSMELAKDSAAYQECVADKIFNLCVERNFKPGTDEFYQCENDLRNATFIRQQMQIRGF